MRIWIDVAPSVPGEEESRSRRDELVIKHLKLVRTLAVRIRRKLPAAVELNDLFQAGVVGLLKAMETYDVSKDGDFGLYAGRRIKATIIDSLSQFDGAPRLERQHRRLRKAAASPAVAEPANLAAVPVAGVSLNPEAAGLFREDIRTLLDMAADPESQPDHICERNEQRLTIWRAIGRLPQRHREVLVCLYQNGMTAKEIGGRLGVTECRVSQIRRKALQAMSTALEAGGLAPPRFGDNSRAAESNDWMRLSIFRPPGDRGLRDGRVRPFPAPETGHAPAWARPAAQQLVA